MFLCCQAFYCSNKKELEKVYTYTWVFFLSNILIVRWHCYVTPYKVLFPINVSINHKPNPVLAKKYAKFLLNYANFIALKTSTNIIFISSVLLQIVNLQCNGFSVNAHVSIEQSVGHFKMTILSHFSHSGNKLLWVFFRITESKKRL